MSKEEKYKITFRNWVFMLNNYTKSDIVWVAKPKSAANHPLKSPFLTQHFHGHAFLYTLN